MLLLGHHRIGMSGSLFTILEETDLVLMVQRVH